MSKKGAAAPDEYIPQSAGEAAFMQEMLDAAEQVKHDVPWTDFEFADLLAAWPDPLEDVAKAIHAPTPALRAFLDGNLDAIRQEQILGLRKLLCIHRDRFGGDYIKPEGPYILAPITPEAARVAYGAVTCGGDVEFCCEFVPDTDEGIQQVVDMRAPHIIGYSRGNSDLSLILVPRTSATLSDVWKSAFDNLSKEPVPLCEEDYTAFLKTALCARQSPESRAWILKLHSELYGNFIDELGREIGRFAGLL